MVIERLKRQHDRASFSSGVPALDDYLKKRANQDAQRYIAVSYVLSKNQTTIIGFYTLSSTSIDLGELPEDIAKKLPRYPLIPATLIGRLAVDYRYRGHRYGEYLLLDALYKTFNQANKIDAAAVVVEAKDDKARSFYKKYDFKIFPDQPNRLFIPMTIVKKLFG